MKRYVSLMLILALLCGLCISAQAEETVSYTWWIAKGEDMTYYDNYAQNPVVQYLLTKTYAGKQVNVEFWQGISGSERENFNNMISTDSLADVVDLSYSDYTAATLLEDGYILDLTPYVEQYMPNYTRLLQEDEELANFAYSIVDGEKKILYLANYNIAEPFDGLCYRRDWLVKYGKNPVTGATFIGGFDENGTWSDDVVFPNGTDTPLYISDWEWMFDIFTQALQDQGITDGYCTSLYYEGAMGSGDLYSSFGGGSPWWYRDSKGNAAYGATSDNMRAYLKCMNTWYNKGWLDKSFAQRSGDMFYAINSTAVHQGKVGMWFGLQSEIGGGMDIGTPLTAGIMVFPAPLPINDVYGDEAQKNHEPDCYYTLSSLQIGVGVTKAAKSKDLAPLFALLDEMFDIESGTYCNQGMPGDLIAPSADDAPWKVLYEKFGLENGMWERSDEEGIDGYYVGQVDSNTRNAMKGNRLVKGYGYRNIKWTEETRSAILSEAIALWSKYDRPAYIMSNIDGLISSRNTQKKTKIENNQRTFIAQNAPKFIMGQKGFDIENDADWGNFCKTLNKYGVDKVTEMYQEAFDLLR